MIAIRQESCLLRNLRITCDVYQVEGFEKFEERRIYHITKIKYNRRTYINIRNTI